MDMTAASHSYLLTNVRRYLQEILGDGSVLSRENLGRQRGSELLQTNNTILNLEKFVSNTGFTHGNLLWTLTHTL